MKTAAWILCMMTVVLFPLAGCQNKEERPQHSSGNTGQLRVVGLLCGYRVDPVGLDEASPRLSWRVESAQRGQRQTAYQIRVASERSLLDKGQGDLWDSGTVNSAATLHIPYQGSPLVSYQVCWWSVRVWDKDGMASDWSVPARWTMGILSQEEWKGKWIGYAAPYSTPEELTLRGTWRQEAISPILRKTFRVAKPVRSAFLYISGLGFHESYLNGAKVGDQVLSPAFTQYDRACLYVTHEVTDRLQQGDNALGVMLGNGWYNVFTHAAWDFYKAAWRDHPKAMVQLRIAYRDGTAELICSDPTWKVAAGPVVLDGIRQGETYDARRERPGWAKADYDDSGWAEPTVVSPPKGILRSEMMPPMKVVETLTPKAMTEPQPGVFVFDLGQNMAGWCRLTVAGPAGTAVKIRYGERVDGAGMLDVTKIKEHVRGEVFQTDTYILKGQGVETWEPRFTYHGFQYIEITGYPGRPSLDSIRGRVVHTAFEQSGQFSCSNDLLNKIQHCALWSYWSNYHGYPTDCPHREKNGWTGDAHLASEMAMYNIANGAGYTKWMMDFHDEQRDSGELPGIVPTGGWGYSWGNGPAWDSAYLIIPWEMYRYFGDTGILEVHYERFKRYVDYLTSRADGHIVSIGLGDWVPAKTETPVEVTSTAFYYRDASITAKTAQILGHDQDAAQYAALADRIKEAFQSRFYKGDGIYANGSQTALSVAIYYGLVPESERPKVLAKLVENVRSQNDHIDTGILGAKAIFNVLSENGEHETAYRLATQTTPPSYGDWILRGATTLWEDWPGDNSKNHIMFGDISAWFYKNLAGINVDGDSPDSVGFGRFVIRPRPVGDLTEAKAVYQSVRGTIESQWAIREGHIELTVSVPANTTATVYVPTADAASVTESGVSVATAVGVSVVKEEGGYAVFNVESGRYRFVSVIR